MMHISPERKSIVAITLLSIVAIMIGCSSQHDTVATSEQYEYDRDGRLICKTTPDGSKIKYKYNKQGLPSEIEYPDDSVKYGYDANGNRIWMQNRNGKTEYKYDAFERLSEVIFKCSPEKKIVYEYDPWNRISSIRISDAQNNHYQVKYEYNILGNLVSIDDGNGRVEYNYSPAKGEIIRQLPNGIKTVFSYSPAGELISIKHSDSQNSLLAFYRYEYNPPGKISRVFEETSEALNITRFEWDNRGYLKNLQLPDGKSVHYEYDAMGNRISIKDSKGTIAYKYNGLGRLIEAGDTKFEWDGNGNLMTQIDNNTKTRFRYDARNLPQLVKTPNESFRYKWDGDGNIISRSVGKDINYYMPNPLAYPVFSLAEFDGTGKMKSSYLYGDSLLGQRDANGRMKYFLEDGFNSVRHITDTNGKIIGQQDFTPFAEHTSMKEETADNFRMMGERFLPEIKKSFIGNRLYDPSTGRYLSPDPEPGYIERPDSFNRYTHGSPNPSNFMEPRSNQTIEHQPTLGSIWQNLRSLPIGREKLDWPLNFVGRVFNLNWFGRNVTGGQWYVYDRDEQNQFSLGNTTIPGRNSFDMAARKHDIQYYINTHFDRGTWVQVPGPKGDEYFRSLGSTTVFPAWWTNIIVFRDMLLGNLAHHSGRTSLPLGQTAIPLRRDSAKSNDLHTGNYFKHGKRQLDEFYDDSRKYFFPPPPGCPPFCDDGGGASRPFGGGLYDPFKSIEAKLGGIKLDAAAQFTGNLDNITGAVYDQEKQVLVLVGDENKDKNISLPSIKPEDLAIALISVYGSEHISPQNPQFSLDPADPKNPRGEWLKAVYIPEQIIGGTEFGKALYEADWLLKQYSFGVTLDAEGKMQERKSSVPGLKSTADLSYEEKDREHGKERWNRFWIVSDDMKLKQSGKSIYFDTAKMRVKAKKQVPDPRSPTGLSDVDSEDDPVATKFAKGFTDLYDEIAKESPEFERVRQLAKAVAIAKWMKQERIPFDTGWVNEYANKRVDTVGRVTALSTQWEKSNQTPFQRGNQSGILTQIHKIHLFGGVDLTVNPKFISDDGNAQRLQKAVTAKLREKVVGPTFYVNHNGKAYRAVILPVTSQGQAIWKNSPTTTINGTRYQFNKQGDVANSTDINGNVTEYAWDANHKLDEFKIIANDGWLISGKKKNGYSEITATNPLQNKFLYRYTPTGYLNEVIINGQRYASIKYDGNDATIDYGNYLEQIRYDSRGRIKRYEIASLRDGVPSGKPQVLNINYDKDGYPTEIYIPDTEHIRLAYSDGNIRTVGTSRGKVDYLYEAQTGRISQINTTWGESQRYDYAGNKLTQITTKKGDYQKDIVFKDNLPVEVKDNNGGSTKYKYHTSGLIEQVTDPTGATGNYSYDGQNRIKTISLPDGSSFNIQYEWYGTKEAKESAIKKIKVTQVVSKISSSPLMESKSSRTVKAKEISQTLSNRLEDIKEAGRNLKDGLIIDVFVGEKDAVNANFVDAGGNVLEIKSEDSKEIRRLLRLTSTTEGKLGSSLLDRWQKFYDANLSHLSKLKSWTCPDGREVKIKPVLVLKTNEVNFKYANLEKVPVLSDNFIVFIANKTKVTDTSETTAKELVANINNIPKLTQNNVAFLIRLPDISKKEQEKWYTEINDLQGLVGKDNVLVDPSKEEFQNMIQNKGKDIVAFELTHTDKGIVLKNGERYTSKDIKQTGNLSHIKYLVSGLGTCSLPRLEDGKFTASLREKGVGIINASYREVSSEKALERLKELINILRNIKKYDLYPYQLIDIIDQKLGISGDSTINLGERVPEQNYFEGRC